MALMRPPARVCRRALAAFSGYRPVAIEKILNLDCCLRCRRASSNNVMVLDHRCGCRPSTRRRSNGRGIISQAGLRSACLRLMGPQSAPKFACLLHQINASNDSIKNGGLKPPKIRH